MAAGSRCEVELQFLRRQIGGIEKRLKSPTKNMFAVILEVEIVLIFALCILHFASQDD
jgi:hypothetical protein